MRNAVCIPFVHLAELRVEMLRGLRAFASVDLDYLALELAEAERELEERRQSLARCPGHACSHQCSLYAPIGAQRPSSEAA